MTEPTDVPSPSAPPIGTASSIGYGCIGFLGFYAVAAVAAGAIGAASGSTAGVVVTLIALVAAAVWVVGAVRRASAHAKAVAVRIAIGFLIALLLFGGCIALISNANFH